MSSTTGAESKSVRELVEESLPSTETVHSLNVTGEEDGTIYVLVTRTGPYKGHMMIKESYAFVDADAETVEWASNGVRRRVNDDAEEFVRSLLRQYSRLQQVFASGETPDDPLFLSADGADDSEARARLDEPLNDTDDEDDVERTQAQLLDDGDDLDADERVECHKCGRKIARKNADDFGGFGLGTSVFVCSDGCNDE